MKLRRTPEDFQVTELTDVSPQRSGLFSLYRLTKRDLGTPEAIDQVLQAWNLPRSSISYGGLKDTHAVTSQFITIRKGPQRDLKRERCSLTYLGHTPQPFTPQQIAGNEFQLVLRSMSPAELDQALPALHDLQRGGLPNYYDDQRFGSVGESGEFIVAACARGDYERALWLTFADPNRFDRSREKEQKKILRDLWGDWKACKAALEKSHRRSIVTFLDDRPGDFRGAWARVRQDMRSLYVASLQSHLWNEILAEWLTRSLPVQNLTRVPLKLTLAPFPTGAGVEEFCAQHQQDELPLPSARMKLEPGPIQELVDETLARLGWQMRELRIKYPRDCFFSKGWRRALIQTRDLHWSTEVDELSPQHQKLTLKFQLPRGSYATILVKRITVAAGATVDDSPEDEGDVLE